MTCARCGHSKMLHKEDDGTLGFRPACLHIDADGPCMCRAFKPCTHTPESITSRGDQLVRVCACGQAEEPILEM